MFPKLHNLTSGWQATFLFRIYKTFNIFINDFVVTYLCNDRFSFSKKNRATMHTNTSIQLHRKILSNCSKLDLKIFKY